MVGVFYGFFLWCKSIEHYITNFYILGLALSAFTSIMCHVSKGCLFMTLSLGGNKFRYTRNLRFRICTISQTSSAIQDLETKAVHKNRSETGKTGCFCGWCAVTSRCAHTYLKRQKETYLLACFNQLLKEFVFILLKSKGQNHHYHNSSLSHIFCTLFYTVENNTLEMVVSLL